ncbi:MAG: hypothetical protein ACYTGR_04870 [Planctomycetota bacterium]
MTNAVHLAGLRCDGTGHGGCQAGCLLFWKEAWLQRADPAGPDLGHVGTAESAPAEIAVALTVSALQSQPDEDPPRYKCQATEMLNATSKANRRDRRGLLVRDLTSGNVQWHDFVRYGPRGVLNAFLWRRYRRLYPHIRSLAGDKTPTLDLDLQPGERVRVRSKAEIERTLKNQKNRGMWFDVEMLQYCGKEFTVVRRVEKILNEKTGEMIHIKTPCIILDGATCTGNYLRGRMFSPRNEYAFWREIWLERVGDRPEHSA